MDPQAVQRHNRDRMATDTRIISPGPVRWGAQTRLAVQSFPNSGEPVPREVIPAIAMVKAEAAAPHLARGMIDGAIADAIVTAADE